MRSRMFVIPKPIVVRAGSNPAPDSLTANSSAPTGFEEVDERRRSLVVRGAAGEDLPGTASSVVRAGVPVDVPYGAFHRAGLGDVCCKGAHDAASPWLRARSACTSRGRGTAPTRRQESLITVFCSLAGIAGTRARLRLTLRPLSRGPCERSRADRSRYVRADR